MAPRFVVPPFYANPALRTSATPLRAAQLRRQVVEVGRDVIEARVRRQVDPVAQTKLAAGDIEMDLLRRRVTRAGVPVELKPTEFRLLEYLLQHKGQAVTRTMILENVWSYHFDPQTNIIDVHISRLRARIDSNRPEPLIATVRGTGYTIRE